MPAAGTWRRSFWRRVTRWLPILTACACLVYLGVFASNYILGIKRSTRSDQETAMRSKGGKITAALRHHTTVWGDSVPGGTVVLPDSSVVVLDRGSHLTYLTRAFAWQWPTRYLLLDHAASFALRSRWLVTTDLGTVALDPGRYTVQVLVQGTPKDSGMLMTVLSGAADAWPAFGIDRDLVHVDAGSALWLPRVGRVPPPYKVEAR
jgi:hypothetical protein